MSIDPRHRGRRALLRGMVAAAASTAWPCDATTPSAPARAAVLRRAVSEPASLDPLRYGSVGDYSILSDLFTGLTAIGPDGTIVPGCAARWQASRDALRWTFQLRRGPAWSDGRALTAQDFVWSAQRYLDPASAGLLAFRFRALRHAAAIAAARQPAHALGLRALDPLTVEVELEYPQLDLPTLLAVLLPAPRHRVEALGEAWTRPANWVSNGAFVLRSRVVGDRIVLARNPRFCDAGTVRLDRVELVVTEAAAAFPRYRARELDVVRVVPEAVSWARREAPGELRQSGARSTTFVLFNARHAPFDDARVRRALSLAIDRDALARQVRGGDAEPAWGYVAPSTRDYQAVRGPAWRDWPVARRLEAARRLLAAAGYGAGRPLALRLDFIGGTLEKREAVALAAMWRHVGVTTTLRSSDPRTLHGNLQRAEAIVLEEQPLAPLLFPAWQELVAPRVAVFPENPTSIRQSRWLAIAS